MRCSTELIAFRAARDQILEALASPRTFGMIQIVRRYEAFQAAGRALLICLGIEPFF